MRSSHLAILCLAVLLSPVTSCGGGDSTGPALPARLVFSVQPGAATAGAAFAAAPQVTVQDAQGIVLSSSTLSITVALATGAGTAGAHLRGTATVAAAKGVAVFNGLSIDSVGTGYALTASASGVPTSSSAPFGVVAAPAQLLAFTVQPSDAAAATAISPAIRLVVRDSVGNTATSSTTSVTLAITSGTGTSGAVLGGTLTVAAVSGIATFDNLSVDKVGNYTLTASAVGRTSATSGTFAIRAGAAAKLAFAVQPTDVATGSSITPAVQVTVQDAQGNTVTASTVSVTLAITGGTGTGGAALGGTLTVAAVNGVATFSTLTVDRVGTGYTLTVTATGLTNATSTAFTVTPGVPTKLAFSVQPTAVAAGAAIAPTVQVTIQDAQGNTVTAATTNVTLAITSETGTTGAVLGGTLTQAAVSGVATFGNLTIDKVGTGYTLTATATSLTSATSSTFAVTPGAAAKLAFNVQPTNVVAGSSITPAVQVAVQDAQGNTVTSSTASVTVAISSGTGKTGANLRGANTFAATAGIATFPGLSIDSAGTGYTLTATASGLTSAVSTALTVTAGAATRVGFAVQPGMVNASMAMVPAVQVAVLDSLGNRVTSSTATVTLAITAGTGTSGAVLGGTLSGAAMSGLASFADLTVDSPGTSYTLTATSGVLGAAASLPFDVSPKPVASTLASGDEHTCAVSVAGAAYCWGRNFEGELGDGTDGTITWRTSPVAVAGGLVFQSIGRGIYHTCGLTTGGATYCWGWNLYGQLGDGSTINRFSPVPVAGGFVFQAISGGESHICGLTTGGVAYCWGTNDSGKVGDGTTIRRTSPVPVAGGLVFQTISAGLYHTCGLTTGGAAYCWGWNFPFGMLGDGTVTWRTSPVPVAGGLVFQTISAGLYHTCGLTTGGDAYCWGFNRHGQLGNLIPYEAETRPVPVVGGLVRKAISPGYDHTCGLTTGGAAYCWGLNDHGQLGDGGRANMAAYPIAVAGGLVFQAISAGSSHTCGLTSVGSIYCWGRNHHGQLGDGTTTDRLSPVRVIGF